jgi:hypothetical protein
MGFTILCKTPSVFRQSSTHIIYTYLIHSQWDHLTICFNYLRSVVWVERNKALNAVGFGF